MDRFELWDFFEPDDCSSALGVEGEREVGAARGEQLISCAEEMLRLLLTVVSAREFAGACEQARVRACACAFSFLL